MSTFYREPMQWDPKVKGVDPQHLENLYKEEKELYVERTKKSQELYERAKKTMIRGYTNSWGDVWHVPNPFYMDRCKDNKLWDVDGNKYFDFNLGDTPDFYGHAPDNEVYKGIIELLQNNGINGLSFNEDSMVASEILQERFGLKYWYSSLSASDANRFAAKLAKTITGRPKILQMNMAYHGTVDETNAWMPEPGVVEFRVPEVYPGQDPNDWTRVAEFNDLESVEEQLKHGDVAVVMTEPALTNSGLLLPEPGFHEGLRKLCDKYGAYLLIDETHTQTSGYRGLTGEWGLKPDFWVAGKCIAGGIPCGVYGFTEEIGEKFEKLINAGVWNMAGLLGQQTTMTGNALSMRALRLNLEHNVTEEVFDKMVATQKYLCDGLTAVIEKYNVPISITQLGARAFINWIDHTPENIVEAVKSIGIVGHYMDYLFLYLFNRGVMIIPFGFNMWLVSPQTTNEDCDVFIKAFDGCIKNMFQK